LSKKETLRVKSNKKLDSIKKKGDDKDKTYEIIAAKYVEYKEELVPIPDIEKMVALKELSPDSLDKIIDTSIETIKNINELRAKEEKRIGRDTLLGLIAGLLIAISFLLASWDLVKNGHEVAGTVLGTIDLVALVTVFVKGSK